MKPADQLKIFGMQNLLLESDLAKLEGSGIDIGHSKIVNGNGILSDRAIAASLRARVLHIG